MSARLRRPGSPWRILVHEWLGTRRPDGIRYGKAHDVTNDRQFGRLPLSIELRQMLDAKQQADEEAGLSQTIVLPGTEFDELVIGHWIHLEQMNASQWWMNIGGVTVWVTADRDGRPRRVSVYGPNDYDAPVDGCAYDLKWKDAEL